MCLPSGGVFALVWQIRAKIMMKSFDRKLTQIKIVLNRDYFWLR